MSHIQTRIAALAAASFFTLVMLVGVNGLAQTESQDLRLAKAVAIAQA